jgi:hypothetical protein
VRAESGVLEELLGVVGREPVHHLVREVDVRLQLFRRAANLGVGEGRPAPLRLLFRPDRASGLHRRELFGLRRFDCRGGGLRDFGDLSIEQLLSGLVTESQRARNVGCPRSRIRHRASSRRATSSRISRERWPRRARNGCRSGSGGAFGRRRSSRGKRGGGSGCSCAGVGRRGRGCSRGCGARGLGAGGSCGGCGSICTAAVVEREPVHRQGGEPNVRVTSPFHRIPRCWSVPRRALRATRARRVPVPSARTRRARSHACAP